MKYLRLYAGILLLILAVSGLIFWETTGRDRVMMDEVIAASRDIRAGSVVAADMLQLVRVPKDSRIENGFPAGEESKLIGKKTASPIAGNQQISSVNFVDEDEEMKADEAFFVIPAEWIAMRTSALRRGDTVEIYTCGYESSGAYEGDETYDGSGAYESDETYEGEETYEDNGTYENSGAYESDEACEGMSLGRYRLAFVKNAEEGEVRDMLPSGELLYEPEETFARTDADSVIDHVEIIATKSDYARIREYAAVRETPSLLLVQRGRTQ